MGVLNCTNGTKSRNASHLDFKDECIQYLQLKNNKSDSLSYKREFQGHIYKYELIPFNTTVIINFPFWQYIINSWIDPLILMGIFPMKVPHVPTTSNLSDFHWEWLSQIINNL